MNNKLSNFHIMFYAVTMGLGGLGVAYFKLASIFGLNLEIFNIFRIFTTAIFLLISFFYILKIFYHFDMVKKEFSHLIKINFFAAFPISMLLLAILWEDNGVLYKIFFYLGTAILTFLTLYVVSFWINKNLEIKHSNPAWFIPIVGNLLVVIADKNLDPWLWYYFSIGIFFYIILFGIIFYRILFHDQLPIKYMPTLFILIAPPAIGFLGFGKLSGEFGIFSLILLNLAIFFAMLVIFMYKNFLKLKFFLSWWAFTFPTAALFIALIKAYTLTNSLFFKYFGFFIFGVLCLMIVFISYHTIKNIINGNIFSD